MADAAGDGYFQLLLHEVSTAVRKSGAERTVSAAFARCSTDDQRVEFVLRSPLIRPVLDTAWRRVDALAAMAAASAPAESAVEAQAERERGNALFRGGRIAEALDAYSRAIMHCRRDYRVGDEADGEAATVPTADNCKWCEILALCYANRSAVWFRLGDHDSCLDDIEATIACGGYPDRLLYKLFDRRARCLLATGGRRSGSVEAAAAAAAESVQCALEALEHARLGASDEAAFRRSLEALSRDCKAATVSGIAAQPPPTAAIGLPELANGPSDACGSLSSLVDVTSSGEHGRHVIARKPIDVGEVLLVENPFACVPALNCLKTHCYACLRRLQTIYPCRRCADVMYCSRRCEAASWATHHRLECGRTHTVAHCGVAMGHLALRAALTGGLVYHCCCVRRCLSVAEAAAAAAGCRNVSADEATLRRYGEVHRLESHENDRSPSDLFWRTLAALYLARCVAGVRLAADVTVLLATAGSASGENGEDEAIGSLAAVVLHHLQVFPCNAHEVSELRGMAGMMHCSDLVEIGAGIYAVLSLFNHSCDPDVTRTFVGGRTAVVRALRPLAAGEQVFDNYGVVYATHTSADRRAKLRQQYYFDCACTACTANWPLYDSLLADTILPLHTCPCRLPVAPPQPQQQRGLASNVGAVPDAATSERPPCIICSSSSSAQAQQLQAELKDCLAAVCDAGDCTSDQANRIAACLRRLYALAAKPYKAFNDCEEALKHCFNRAGNCYEMRPENVRSTASKEIC